MNDTLILSDGRNVDRADYIKAKTADLNNSGVCVSEEIVSECLIEFFEKQGSNNPLIYSFVESDIQAFENTSKYSKIVTSDEFSEWVKPREMIK
jgi:hypothetical protein